MIHLRPLALILRESQNLKDNKREQQRINKKWFRYMLVFSASIALAKTVIFSYDQLDLFFEEAQYWLWSKHLALSYYTKPGMIAWTNYISTSLLGDHEWVIKLNAALVGLLTSVVYFFLAKSLTGNAKVGFYSVLTLHIFPFFVIPSSYFTTDSLLMLFWGLSCLLLWQAIQKNSTLLWVLLGASCGLGFLSKYTMVLFIPFAFIYLIIIRRELLLKANVYISIAVAAVFSLPEWIWNFQNDFVSFFHLQDLGDMDQSASIFGKPKFIFEYIGSQVGALGLFLFVSVILATRWAILKKRDSLIYTVSGPLVVFIFFLLFSFHDRVEVNWTFFAYPSIAIAIAYYWSNHLKRPFHRLNVILSSVLIILFLFPQTLDLFAGQPVIPVKVDTQKRLAGWSALGERVDQTIADLDTDEYFVFAADYQVASQVTFYSDKTDHQNIYSVDVGQRGNQFDLWPGLDDYVGHNYYGIFVSKDPVFESVSNSFTHLISQGYYPHTYRGDRSRGFYIYIFQKLKDVDFKH